MIADMSALFVNFVVYISASGKNSTDTNII